MLSRNYNKMLNRIIANAGALPLHRSSSKLTLRHLSLARQSSADRLRLLQHHHNNSSGVFQARGLPQSLMPCRQQQQQASITQVPRPYVDPELSYAYGKSEEHLEYTTIGRELDKQAKLMPDALAWVSHAEKISVTFRQFNEDIDKLAKAMVTKYGIEKGDFVGVYAYNCYNWILVQYACARVGAVLTPINPSYRVNELSYILARGKIKMLFVPGFRSVQAQLNDHQKILSAEPLLGMFKARSGGAAGPLLESVVIMDDASTEGGRYSARELEESYPLAKYCKFDDWHSATSHADTRLFRSTQEAEAAGVSLDDACILSPERVSPEDTFAVYYTSGTTGIPKGAKCSQFTVLNNVRLAQIRLRDGRPRGCRIVTATPLPMFHIYAGVLMALAPAINNTAIVLPGHRYNIKDFFECIVQHGANVATITPTMLIDLLTYLEQNPELVKRADVPLKMLQLGGAMLPPELVSRTFKTLPTLEQLRPGYGSTENGSVSTFQTVSEPEATRSTSAGPPLDFTEIRIVAPGTSGGEGPVVPLGERGEIQTRGHNIMTGYLDDDARTQEVILRNRWYRTGDIGIMHPHGSIEISGRLKEMIIRGGENIYPEEVEQMMHTMECIEKAHVVGVPDKRYGEQVCAWVKLRPGYAGEGGDYHEQAVAGEAAAAATGGRVISKEQVINFCKENITYFKVPKYLFFVQDFPMTPTKKVQKSKMVEESIKILKLEGEPILKK